MAYPNGQVPASARMSLPGSNAGLLRQAALSYRAMDLLVSEDMSIYDGSVGRTYRTYQMQVLAKRIFGSNAATPGSSNHGLATTVDLMRAAQRAAIDRAGRAFGWAKEWSDACVPLDTRILTRDGFKTCDELRPWDETVGYDPATGTTRWTPILGINRYETDVLRHQHSTVTLDATAGHRWLTTGRRASTDGAELRTLAEIDATDPQQRLLLAAPHTGSNAGPPITPDEAALIGWALTDGSIYRFANSRGQRAFARVYQRKAVGIAAVDSVMTGFEHRRDPTYNDGSCVMWYVGREAFSPVLHRSGLDEMGVVRWVLALDDAQRRAFLDAVYMAEGDQTSATPQIAQADGERRDAFAIAAALDGRLVALRPKTINLKRPRVQRDRLTSSSLGVQQVWCPTIGLGSWTAEQNGHIFLTGNSWEWWHLRWRDVGWRPRPDPLRYLGPRRRQAASTLLYRRRRRAAEARTGKGPRWRKWEKAVGRSHAKVERLWRRAKDGEQKQVLRRVLEDRNGVI